MNTASASATVIAQSSDTHTHAGVLPNAPPAGVVASTPVHTETAVIPKKRGRPKKSNRIPVIQNNIPNIQPPNNKKELHPNKIVRKSNKVANKNNEAVRRSERIEQQNNKSK